MSDIVMPLLQSPVLVAMIGAMATLAGGVVMGRAKDEQIKGKEEQLRAKEERLRVKEAVVAGLEKEIKRLRHLSPGDMVAYIANLKRLYEGQLADVYQQADQAQKALEEQRDMTARERDQLHENLSAARDEITFLRSRVDALSGVETGLRDDTSPEVLRGVSGLRARNGVILKRLLSGPLDEQ